MVVSGDEAIRRRPEFSATSTCSRRPARWSGTTPRPPIAGTLVHGYTQSFLAHWNQTARAKGKQELVVDEGATRPSTGEKLYYPPPRGPPRGKAAIAGTDERIGTSKATFTYRTALRLALSGARESVFLTNPYFTSPWVAGEIAATAPPLPPRGARPRRASS
jgi:hypothetical protein